MMPAKKKGAISIYLMTGIAIMAAIVYVVTMFSFPFLGSKVHFANAVCLLSGLLLGPIPGGIAAGLGSALNDVFLRGYDLANVLITFVSKFAMAWLCGMLGMHAERKPLRTVLACVLGALSYVALYMLKTWIYQAFVYGYPPATVSATMVSKLIPSLINALVAVIAAPVFYHALLPALRSTGVLERIRRGDAATHQ